MLTVGVAREEKEGEQVGIGSGRGWPRTSYIKTLGLNA